MVLKLVLDGWAPSLSGAPASAAPPASTAPALGDSSWEAVGHRHREEKLRFLSWGVLRPVPTAYSENGLGFWLLEFKTKNKDVFI